MPASLKTITLGCKVNQYETELVREGLRRIGYHDAAEDEAPDLCVVNTCTVTAEGDSKSRHVIRKLARDNPQTRIVVMGCYATRAPEEVAALPNVSEVVTDKREIPDLLGRFGVVDIPTGISRFTGRKRAYVKVQDGCLLRCSYCIIPFVRPNVYSRPLEHIRDEVARLVDNGHREIILTGVHLGHYGVELNHHKPREEWLRLATLVRTLCKVPGEFRIRLSSIEATEVTRDLIGVMAENPGKIAPHLHICLQSGSDAVLRRMKRRWGSKLFVDRCRLVRETLDQPGLSTDVIVGFPGETEEDFAATCQVVRDCGFAKIHIFPFSARKGTPAFDMPDKISHEVKQERLRRLEAVAAEVRDEYYRSLLGRRLQVMIEGQSEYLPSGFAGTSCRYAPVEIEATGLQPSTLVDAVGYAVRDGRIIARLPSGA
ncbi:tRNA (N(6)-L-threonylcarbamoyladenosine(37)-C(2))-methylthiotransferase MtaB [Anatilimnocola sp. NA78]|uniref:tRNA (N(6)-L-threonylcarbamoyladenosine(37)-C(2))- methylthiotransferase MtaB n=1 Tax=Anatilimnocola sp. NA78 TaxID=3415683 RepID=UPI003CE5B02B